MYTHHLLPVTPFFFLELSCHASSAALSGTDVPDYNSSEFSKAEGQPVVSGRSGCRAGAWASDSWKTAPTHFTAHHTHISPVGQFPSCRSRTPSNFEHRKSQF